MRPEFLKAGGDVRRNWRAVNEALALSRTAGDAASEALRLGLGRQDRARAEWHGFRIYRMPPHLRGEPAADDWRKVRVRGGWCLGGWATGTDGSVTPEDGVITAGTGEVTVPAETEEYWFWLETSAGTTSVEHGAAGWTGFPVPDAEHIPIGYVDTETLKLEGTAVIHQLLHDHVVSAGGGGGVYKARVVAHGTDYVTANLWEGPGATDYAAGTVNVAKPPELQFGVAGFTFRGVTVTYGSYNATTQERVCSWARSASSGTETQVIVRPYVAGDVLMLARANNTGVTVGGVAVAFQDLNVGGRAWAKKYVE